MSPGGHVHLSTPHTEKRRILSIESAPADLDSSAQVRECRARVQPEALCRFWRAPSRGRARERGPRPGAWGITAGIRGGQLSGSGSRVVLSIGHAIGGPTVPLPPEPGCRMSSHPAQWEPSFPGQRPPFRPGHELSVQHGAYSPRKVDPLATELVELLLTDDALGYLKAPAYRPALWAWARAESQVQLLTEYLEQRGKGGVGDLGDERIRSAHLLLHRAEARAQSGRRQLGLDPLSRARLGKDVAQGRAADAAAELTRMREEFERAQQGAGAGGTDDD